MITHMNGVSTFFTVFCSNQKCDTISITNAVKKKGNDAFVFPTGRQGHYKPAGISAPASLSDAFVAAYFNEDSNADYPHTSKNASLNDIETNEYWLLNRASGSSDVIVTLSWDNMSCSFDTLANLRIAAWDGSEWENMGKGATTGNAAEGTISSNGAATVFGAYTLATTDTFRCVPCRAFAHVDTSIIYGQGIWIGSNLSSSVSNHEWIPITGLSDNSIRNPIADPLTSTTYRLIVTNSTGCEATDMVYIHVIYRPPPDMPSCILGE